MSDLIQAADFPRLWQNRTPLLDVRAPAEFARGAFPHSKNIPLLDDQQRQAVGQCYRHRGRQAAIALGEQLVSGAIRQQRLQQWQSWLARHPNPALYCFRGGLRSSIVQQWLGQEGIRVPRVAGGYKALRHSLIEQIEQFASGDHLILIAGKTGSGKTHLLNSLPNSLDLEGLARHRGSAFGRRVPPQATPVAFENQLAIHLLTLHWGKQQRVAMEDESRAIGSVAVPLALYQRMGQAPIAVLECSLEQRVDTIHQDYIQSNYQDFRRWYPAQAEQRFAASLLQALERIRRRLGDERCSRIKGLLQDAIVQQFQQDDSGAHRQWIRELLIGYYDPMYEYQLGRKIQRVVFRGSRDELASWIQPWLGQTD